MIEDDSDEEANTAEPPPAPSTAPLPRKEKQLRKKDKPVAAEEVPEPVVIGKRAKKRHWEEDPGETKGIVLSWPGVELELATSFATCSACVVSHHILMAHVLQRTRQLMQRGGRRLSGSRTSGKRRSLQLGCVCVTRRKRAALWSSASPRKILRRAIALLRQMLA